MSKSKKHRQHTKLPVRRRVIAFVSLCATVLLLLIAGTVWRWSGSKSLKSPPPEAGSLTLVKRFSQSVPTGSTTRETLAAIPGIESVSSNQTLAPILQKADPGGDDWDTEVFSAAALKQLKRLAKTDFQSMDSAEIDLQRLVTSDFSAISLRPQPLTEILNDGSLLVRRSVTTNDENLPDPAGDGPQRLAHLWRELVTPLREGVDHHIYFKIFRVELDGNEAATTAYFQSAAQLSTGVIQQNATWNCTWAVGPSDEPPRLKSIIVSDYEEIIPGLSGGARFSDWTESILGHNDSFRRQLLRGVDHWRDFLQREFDLGVTGHYGLAVGDVNGDGLDDIYLCQPGGLPNRLYIQQDDGTVRDASAPSGTDWMDDSFAALLVDLDNDGDQDLVITHTFQIRVQRNDGTGKFSSEIIGRGPATFLSAAAADYDNDNDLDIFVCGYTPTYVAGQNGEVNINPLPYHDAVTGAPNMLLRNDGNLGFTNVTEESGLNVKNVRYSLAASWEDYDNDGDLDLYVANDFGRNNLYENKGPAQHRDDGSPQFVDVAARAGVEDIAAGMGVTWGDYNNDGLIDVYISNMFSSAGGRVAYQRRFRQDGASNTLAEFRRHARGNTLFENLGNGMMADVSEDAAVTMGRWAWGAKFLDINNDGLQDIYVANGYLTGDSTDDL